MESEKGKNKEGLISWTLCSELKLRPWKDAVAAPAVIVAFLSLARAVV